MLKIVFVWFSAPTPPIHKKKTRPGFVSGQIQRNSSFSENSSEVDSTVDSPDILENMDITMVFIFICLFFLKDFYLEKLWILVLTFLNRYWNIFTP